MASTAISTSSGVPCLSRQHDLAAVAADISSVRSGRARDAQDAWDVRRLPGGLDDLELAAQYLELAVATPESGEAARLSATFETAGRRGLLTSSLVEDLVAAATLWQNLEGYFRMTCAGAFDERTASAEQRKTLAELGLVDTFDELPGAITATAQRTAAQIDALLSGGLRRAMQ